MYASPALLAYRFRYALASLLTVVFLVCVAAIVTAVGSDTVLNAKAHPYVSTSDMGMSDDTPNVVTSGSYALGDMVQRATLATGRAVYGFCRSVTAVTVQSGKSIVHGTVATLVGTGRGIAAVGRGIGSVTIAAAHGVGNTAAFVLRVPGKLVGAMPGGHAVSSIIRPADDARVPIITAPTSEELAHLSDLQRQEIANWQASQVAANKALGGSVVAGDPTHGGYPADLDNARQDSKLDSWGMYNRECVSYAAWKVYQTYGHMPYWGGQGNANEWPRDAQRAGIPTGSTPQVHSVAISRSGYYGHAMWVEKVQGDMIYVSQYNYDLHGHYSEMWIKASGLTYIYFS